MTVNEKKTLAFRQFLLTWIKYLQPVVKIIEGPLTKSKMIKKTQKYYYMID